MIATQLAMNGAFYIGGVGLTLSGLLLMLPAQAYTTEDLLTVYRVEGENYSALVSRAEMSARSSAQQQFDQDILLTRVVVTVLGQNGGQTAPILVLDVNRNDWRNRPDPRYWSKYYRSTPLLLGLDGTAPVQTAPPPPLPAPVPIPAEPIPGTPGTPEALPDPSIPPLPSGAASPPSVNIPAAPAGEVGLPRSILR